MTSSFIQTIAAICNLIIQIFFIFPYSALTIKRQRQLTSTIRPNKSQPNMISEKVFELCTGSESVSSLLAKDPTLTPGEAWKKLYGHHAQKESKATAVAHRDHVTSDDLQRARECGNWGPTEPSELFLRVSSI